MTASIDNFAPAPTASLAALAGRYLTFNLNRESYAIPVSKVREIVRFTSITPVPRMPDYIRGVINLRGRIIPVVDLRIRYACPDTRDTEHTCIIVAHIRTQAGHTTPMGLIVDAVDEVTSIGAADIEPPPDFGAQLVMEDLLGMARVRGTVKALLDIDRAVGGAVIPHASAGEPGSRSVPEMSPAS